MKRARGGFVTIALFALAATLLTFSVVGSSQAALTYFSQTYGAEVSMQDIGVTLMENGADVSKRDYTGSDDVWDTDQGELVGKMLTGPNGEKEELRLGHQYKEELAVTNSGKIDEYVRVKIYRYWEDAQGNKRTDLDPGYIDLHLVNEDSWYQDQSAGSTTKERTVLYYRTILKQGDTTPLFADTLEIEDEGIQAEVTKSTSTDANGNTVITTEYDYNGLKFVLKVDVDAVQTHNAASAIKSAWGVDMSAMGMY